MTGKSNCLRKLHLVITFLCCTLQHEASTHLNFYIPTLEICLWRQRHLHSLIQAYDLTVILRVCLFTCSQPRPARAAQWRWRAPQAAWPGGCPAATARSGKYSRPAQGAPCQAGFGPRSGWSASSASPGSRAEPASGREQLGFTICTPFALNAIRTRTSVDLHAQMIRSHTSCN